LQPATGAKPGVAIGELRAEWRRETVLPEGVSSAMLALCTLAVLFFPLLALILLPVPGNPLVRSIGLSGDLAAETGLLLGLPLIRLLLGWMVPSPQTRLAADRGARLLAGAVLPAGLAVAAMAEQQAVLRLDVAPLGHSLPLVSLLARVLAALAFACTLPVLARGMVLRAPGAASAAESTPVADELGELSGRDAVALRIGEALQLVAVAAFFVAAFLLPLFTQVSAPVGVGVIWVLGLLLVALGIGAWQGWQARQPRAESETERPPLTWWLGVPVLLALAALVAAAWATRGV
jgi:formate hydrogenlyase subunit 4